MQYINGLLALGSDPRNTVPLMGVSVAEVHVLRAIHGHEAVFDVQPIDAEKDVAPRGEIQRLVEKYPARNEDGDHIASKVFAGGAASVPLELADLDLPDNAYRVVERVAVPAPKRKRKPAAEPASAVEPIDDGNSADAVFG